ncbi:protein FAM174C-like isoform X2 [Heterodontus francisci]
MKRGGGGSLVLVPGSASLLLAAALCLSLLLSAAGQESLRSDTGTRNSTSTGPPPRHSGYPDKSVIRRALWVLLGISGLGVVYFIIRSIRLKKTQRKKYGLLSSYDDHVEMAPMDTDDDDTTLFEVKGMRR